MRFVVHLLCFAFGFCCPIAFSRSLAAPPDDQNSNQAVAAAREKWIATYGHTSLQGRFYRTTAADGQIRTESDIVPIKLVVTTANNDDTQEERFPEVFGSRATWYGVEIAVDWRIHGFFHSSLGTKGGGGSAIPEGDRSRLNELIANLPKEAEVLPPAGRRVLVQVSQDDQYDSRVYDRANAPTEVLEILRLSRSAIRAVVTEVKPQAEWQVNGHGEAAFSVCPDGETLLVGEPGWPFRFSFWNSTSQEIIRKEQYWPASGTRHVLFSPNNQLAAFYDRSEGAIVELSDRAPWTYRANLTEPRTEVGGEWRDMGPPAFTSDGKFFVMQSTLPAIRVFDTATWKVVDPPTYFPEGALVYIPARTRNCAVIGTKRGSVALWDTEQRREYATLDESAHISTVAFSSDESRVAAILLDKREFRIGMWSVTSGELVHELHPYEQNTGYVSNLLWTPDDRYVVSATKADRFFSTMALSVWNAQTGRHRGDLIGLPSYVLGMNWLSGGKRIVAGCQDGKVRIWNFEAARDQIGMFEEAVEGNDSEAAGRRQ